MKSSPLVSIIVPAFNAERYLGESLDTVLLQTYRDWEAIVVVDGGCSDGTERVAREYAAKDKRIHVLTGPHERMGAGRNRGIAAARGELLAFLDADNLFLPDKLEKQVGFLTSNPAVDVCYGKILHFYNEEPTVDYENLNERPIEGDPFKSFLARNSINLLAVVLKKELLDRWGAFRGAWPALDDQYLWINLARHGARFAYFNGIVGRERLHRTSDSRRNDHIYDTAVCFLQLLDELEKEGIHLSELRRTWQRNRFIGWLMKTPPFSWVVMPLYLRRRGGHLVRVGSVHQ